jgi:hypothetical protein
MRILTGLVLSALVGGLTVVCLSAFTTLYSAAEGSSPGSIKSTKSGGESISAQWRIGDPVRHENLTLFPVISTEQAPTEDFITLDEGLRAGTVTVSELSAEPSTVNSQSRVDAPNRINAQVQQRAGGGGAQVNRLAVTNNSGKTLILIAGEIVLGGKQDRIVGHDCAIASTNTPVPIEVFCVEHGRWQTRGDLPESSARFDSATEVMAAPKVREKAQAKKDQREVWNEVSEKVTVNGVSTSTGTLNSVFEDKQVKRKLDAYESALKSKLENQNTVGVVVAVGGKIMSADVFANSRLFRAYWPKLFRSFALEAISAKNKPASKVTVEDAEAFLTRVSGTSSTGGKEGVYRLSENQSDSDASFEFEADAGKPKLLHFNRVNKK